MIHYRKFWMYGLCWIVLVFANVPTLYAQQELIIVVNAKGIDSLSQNDVINIFLGRLRQFPTGQQAYPIDQPEQNPLRALFYEALVHKSLAEIKSYWSRLIFSGKTSPPYEASATETVQDWLLNTSGGIGYLAATQPVPIPLKSVMRLTVDN
jgi:hypothetical protein